MDLVYISPSPPGRGVFVQGTRQPGLPPPPPASEGVRRSRSGAVSAATRPMAFARIGKGVSNGPTLGDLVTGPGPRSW